MSTYLISIKKAGVHFFHFLHRCQFCDNHLPSVWEGLHHQALNLPSVLFSLLRLQLKPLCVALNGVIVLFHSSCWKEIGQTPLVFPCGWSTRMRLCVTLLSFLCLHSRNIVIDPFSAILYFMLNGGFPQGLKNKNTPKYRNDRERKQVSN